MNVRQRILLVTVTCTSLGLGLGACARDVDGGLGAGGSPVGAAMDEPTATTTPPTPEVGTPPERGQALAFNATMTGREVVPTVYDTDATGTATFALDADRTTLRYTIEHTLAAPLAVHLHLGLAGQSGEVMLPLPLTPGVLEGTLALTTEQAAVIASGRAYVDVHTAEHPDGEIRGQVARPGELVYVARLTGDQVNPPTDSAGVGVAELLVDGTTRTMRYLVALEGMNGGVTAARVALAPAGSDGPVVVDLADPKTLPPPSFAGERTIASSEDLDLGRWYLDIRSRRYPDGELRGQVLRPGQRLFVGRLTGDAMEPPVATAASGSVSVIVDRDRDRVIADGVVSALDPTAARIVEGSAREAALDLQPLGPSFRALRWLPPASTLLGSLAAGEAFAEVASAAHPDGELRARLVPVGLAP